VEGLARNQHLASCSLFLLPSLLIVIIAAILPLFQDGVYLTPSTILVF
jgi:hypothetical protein